MTYKPIIIDGVDVSKCKYFDCDSKECKAEYYVRYGYEIVEYYSCRKNKNCYYKQLQREKQKREELKKDLHKNFEEKDKLHIIIDRLLEASGYDTNTASAEDFEDVYKNMRYEKQQLEQLGQTLTEIEEIAMCIMDDDLEESSAYYNAKQILQKISEVTENENS